MKSIRQQVVAMQRHWPGFELGEETGDKAVWFGPLAGLERTYRIMIEYGLPIRAAAEMCCRFPLVRVLSPALQLQFDAAEEAPLPHVYFSQYDPTLSPLCLFDVEANEWNHDDLLALTTVPWAADWLACYEGWLATPPANQRRPPPSEYAADPWQLHQRRI
jgi:hypothetical protein